MKKYTMAAVAIIGMISTSATIIGCSKSDNDSKSEGTSYNYYGEMDAGRIVYHDTK